MKKILLTLITLAAASAHQINAKSYCGLINRNNSSFCLIQRIITKDDRDKAYDSLSSKLTDSIKRDSTRLSLIDMLRNKVKSFELQPSHYAAADLLKFIQFQILIPVKKGPTASEFEKIATKMEKIEKTKGSDAQELDDLEAQWDKLEIKEAQKDSELKDFMDDMAIILQNYVDTQKLTFNDSIFTKANRDRLDKNQLSQAKIIDAVQRQRRTR